LCNSVISKVLEGGDGWERGGRFERSSFRDGRDDEREEELLLDVLETWTAPGADEMNSAMIEGVMDENGEKQ
jgi:hypothetical protein